MRRVELKLKDSINMNHHDPPSPDVAQPPGQLSSLLDDMRMERTDDLKRSADCVSALLHIDVDVLIDTFDQGIRQPLGHRLLAPLSGLSSC